MEKSKIRILKKRTRSANFSDQNRDSLFKIIDPFINILENKRTDKHTSILKSKTWQNIVLQYNLINVPHRTGYQLKAFYEAKKRQFKSNKIKYLKIHSSDGTEIKIENISSEISSTTIINNDNNNQNIINDTNEINIIKPMVHIPKTGIPNSSSSSNGSPAVLKCVDIKKLKTPQHKSLPVQPVVVSSTFDIQKQYESPKNNDSSISLSNICNNSNIINSIAKNAVNIANKINTTPIQENINKICIEILNDERKFRRDEHIKRMEFMELSILIMKSNLQRQYN